MNRQSRLFLACVTSCTVVCDDHSFQLVVDNESFTMKTGLGEQILPKVGNEECIITSAPV